LVFLSLLSFLMCYCVACLVQRHSETSGLATPAQRGGHRFMRSPRGLRRGSGRRTDLGARWLSARPLSVWPEPSMRLQGLRLTFRRGDRGAVSPQRLGSRWAPRRRRRRRFGVGSTDPTGRGGAGRKSAAGGPACSVRSTARPARSLCRAPV